MWSKIAACSSGVNVETLDGFVVDGLVWFRSAGSPEARPSGEWVKYELIHSVKYGPRFSLGIDSSSKGW